MGLLSRDRRDGTIVRDGHSSILARMFGSRKKTAQKENLKQTDTSYYTKAYPGEIGTGLKKEYGKNVVSETEKGTPRQQEKLPKVKVKMMAPGKMAEEKAEIRYAQATAEEMKGDKEDMTKFCEHCGSKLKKAYNKKQPKSVREQLDSEGKLDSETPKILAPGQMAKVGKKIILPFTKRVAKKLHNIGCGLYRKNHLNGVTAIWEKFEDENGKQWIAKKLIERV